jgi:polar amino acid transport system substrate-binding protein
MRARLTALLGALLSLSLGLPQAAQAESVVQRVGRTGQLKVLVMNDDLPYMTAQGNGYAGLAMEVVSELQRELSQALNKPVQVTPVPIQSVEQGLNSIASGTADIACGVSYSWGPAMVVDYTLPFALTGVRLLTPPGNDGTPAALAGLPHSLVDISDGFAALALHGPGAARALSSGCPLDLHQAAFPIGMATRTVLGRIGITLWRRAPAEWRLEVPRSHAAYAQDFLAEATRGMPGF